MFDLTKWEYLFTYGYSLLIFGHGTHRVGIDRNTTELVIEYEVK